ncbi:hypothetical protein SCUP234_03411 [Seiridium cupressi]
MSRVPKTSVGRGAWKRSLCACDAAVLGDTVCADPGPLLVANFGNFTAVELALLNWSRLFASSWGNEIVLRSTVTKTPRVYSLPHENFVAERGPVSRRKRTYVFVMLSLLPDLAPRDSHSLWYTSSRNPLAPQDRQQPGPDNSHPHANQRRNAQIIDRSPLARLRADEQNLERRMHNVANFGNAWLKPPGIPKTLHQLREERREQEEHQEAMRREQLAQELAEAEATGGMDVGIGGPSDPDAVMRDVVGSDAVDDIQLDGARDLDDDIPEAEQDFLSADEQSDETDSDSSSESEAEPTGTPAGAARTARLQRELMTQMMRRTHDQIRESVGGEDEVDEEDQEQMIEEGDITGDGADDLGMEVDLDDDIPEGESAGGYEHTDTEAELSSSDDDQGDVSFAAARAPQSVRFRGSLARSDATRNSLAFSDLLSGEGSSMLGSSPQAPRRV